MAEKDHCVNNFAPQNQVGVANHRREDRSYDPAWRHRGSMDRCIARCGLILSRVVGRGGRGAAEVAGCNPPDVAGPQEARGDFTDTDAVLTESDALLTVLKLHPFVTRAHT